MSDVVVKITGDVTDYKNKLGEAKNDTTDFSDVLGSIGKAGAIGFAAVSAVVAKSISEFREQEEATNSLNRAMVNSGVYSRELASAYNEQAEAISKVTTFAGEQVTQAQAVLQQQLGSTKITRELTQAVADFAAAQKIDLASAAEVVGKSIGTSANALGRYGIQVASTADASVKLEQAVKGLNDRFGGQAEAAAAGLGVFDQLNNKVNDLFQNLGGKLAPVFVEGGRAIGSFIDRISDNAAIDGFAKAITFLLKLAFEVGTAFETLGNKIGASLAIASEAAGAALQGQFSRAKEIVSSGLNDINKQYEESQLRLQSQLDAIDKAALGNKEANLKAEEDLVAQSAARKSQIIADQQQADDMASLDQRIEFMDQENAMIMADEEGKLEAQISIINQKLKNANDYNTKKSLADQKANLLSQKNTMDFEKARTKFEEQEAKLREQNQKQTLSTISSLSSSSNQELAAIGKAAALVQIAIDTPVAIGRALAAFPPPINFVAAGAVGVAMAVQASRVAGIAFADGGEMRGGIPGMDSIPSLYMPGELVTPTRSYDEVVDSVADRRVSERLAYGDQEIGGSVAHIVLSLTDDLAQFIEAKIVERQNLSLSILRS